MTDKLRTLAEAAALVESGASLAIGGFTSQRHPMVLLRQIIRRGTRDLIAYAHSSGSDLDLLIGAGCLRRVEAAYVADGVFAPIAPSWRRFIEAGRLEFEDYSNAAMMARFTAGAMGLPCLPTLSMLGSDLLAKPGIDPARRAADPTLARHKAVVSQCPFTDRPMVLVPAINPDVCLLHVQKASRSGLLRIDGQEFLDVQMALAARTVIASCEELVDDAELRREPERNRIPPFAVHAVVHAPWGSHPHGVHNCYDYDPEHLTAYNRAAATEAGFADYLARYVTGPADHAAYLAAVGGAAQLERLRARPGWGYNPELERQGR